MNTILTVQNEPRQIERLAAQRQLYSDAKFWLALQTLGSVGGSVAVSLWAAHDPAHPQVSLYGGLWAGSMTLVDLLWFSPQIKRLKKTAANIQEMFDCQVLQLPPHRKCEPVEPEIISRAAERHDKPKLMSKLPNWYPGGVGVLPLPLARILCQRANCWWDAGLRERYILCVSIGALFIVAGVLVYGLAQKSDFPQLLKGVAFPLAPLIWFCARQVIENKEAVSAANKMRGEANKLWNSALKTPHDLSGLDEESRHLQDDIWDQRGKNPLIFDWIYNRLQRDSENHMNKGAKVLIEEAQEALNQKP